MKKYILAGLLLSFATIAFSQIPYFGSTTGKGKLYSYFQYKYTKNSEAQAFWTSEAYGLTKNIDLDFDFNSADNTIAFGGKYSPYQSTPFSIAIQPMVSFDTKDDTKFSYVCTGLFMNGYIGNWTYILNTWLSNYKGGEYYLEQWNYIGYTYKSITFLAGTTHDLKDKCKTDLAAGCWFPISKAKQSYVYLWAGNLTNHLGDIKLTVGVDYKF